MIAHSPFMRTPGSRCPRFFTRSVKQAGALPNASAVPWRIKTGAWHNVPWTRAPFYEMWGKPKGCREPQDVCSYYIIESIVRQAQHALSAATFGGFPPGNCAVTPCSGVYSPAGTNRSPCPASSAASAQVITPPSRIKVAASSGQQHGSQEKAKCKGIRRPHGSSGIFPARCLLVPLQCCFPLSLSQSGSLLFLIIIVPAKCFANNY